MWKANWFVLLVGINLLSGCASTNWMHPSLSESDFYRDREDCNQYAQATNPVRTTPITPNLEGFQLAQAGIANGSSNMARAFGVQSSFENCLLGKGYRKVQK
jgi:hypothetical protein